MDVTPEVVEVSDNLSECGSKGSVRGPKEELVYVSYKDYQTLTKKMEAFKASQQKELGSDGASVKSSSEEKSGTEETPEDRFCGNSRRRRRPAQDGNDSSSSSSSSRVFTEDTSLVPNYRVHCCNLKFTSTVALFAHLRLIHKIGNHSRMTKTCKLCQAVVNEDFVMLHIELLHTITENQSYRVRVGRKVFPEVATSSSARSQKSRFVKLVALAQRK